MVFNKSLYRAVISYLRFPREQAAGYFTILLVVGYTLAAAAFTRTRFICAAAAFPIGLQITLEQIISPFASLKFAIILLVPPLTLQRSLGRISHPWGK